MTITVAHSTPADGTFSTSGATAWNANHTLSGLGTMAEQNANAVAISGGAISGVTLPASNITGTLPLANGGTAATSAPMAMANLMGFTTTATAAGTTTLTNTSSYYQLFTGSLAQTVVLPVTSTLQTGWTFHICNNSTGSLTVNTSGANLLITINSGLTAMVTCIATSGTGIADWESGFTDFSGATGTGGTVVLSNTPTISGILNFIGSAASNANFATAQTTGNSSICTAQTTGTLTVGNTAGTGTITVGQSTVSQTTNIQAGATASGSTKTVNLGTGGLTGSTTNIAIGSTAGTSTTTCNGKWIFSAGLGGGAF